MNDPFASLVADGLGLPDWAPRAVRRTVAFGLIVTAVFFQTTFRRGVDIFVQHEATRLSHLFQIATLPSAPHVATGDHESRRHHTLPTVPRTSDTFTRPATRTTNHQAN